MYIASFRLRTSHTIHYYYSSHIHTHTYIHARLHTHTHTLTHILYKHIYIHLHTNMHVCMYGGGVRVFVCIKGRHIPGDETPLTPPSCTFFLCPQLSTVCLFGSGHLPALPYPKPHFQTILPITLNGNSWCHCMLEAPHIVNHFLKSPEKRVWFVIRLVKTHASFSKCHCMS